MYIVCWINISRNTRVCVYVPLCFLKYENERIVNYYIHIYITRYYYIVEYDEIK